MTTNQMDMLAGAILCTRFETGNMSYQLIIRYYEDIRKSLSYWNEVLHGEGTVEDECAE